MAVKKVLKENIGLLTFLLSMAIFRSAFADYYSIPSSSMEPPIAGVEREDPYKMH